MTCIRYKTKISLTSARVPVHYLPRTCYIYFQHPPFLEDYKSPCWWEEIPDKVYPGKDYLLKCFARPKHVHSHTDNTLQYLEQRMRQRKHLGTHEFT